MKGMIAVKFYTKVVGVSYDNRQEHIIQLEAEERLFLERDYNNEYDKNAIMVLTSSKNQIGFISKEVASTLAPRIDDGAEYIVTISQITGLHPDENLGVNIYVEECVNPMVNTDFEIENGTLIKYCGYREIVNIPKNVTRIIYSSFANCDFITKIIIHEGVNEFSGVPSLKILESFEVDENNQYYTSVDGILFNKSKTRLIMYPPQKRNIKYVIPEGTTYIDNTFHNCQFLKELHVPSSVTMIQHDTFNHSELLSGIIVNPNNSKYASIDGVLFEKNEKGEITLLRYPEGKINSKYEIPSGVTWVADCAFRNCKNLQYIYVEPDHPWYISDNGILYRKFLNFGYNTNSYRIALDAYPSGKKEEVFIIPNAVEIINAAAFCGCKYLKTIKCTNYITEISGHAFAECSSLERIVPNNTPNNNPSMFDNLFNNEKGLVLPTSIKIIGRSAFEGCHSITKVVIPAQLETSCMYVFDDCPNLSQITVVQGSRKFKSIDGVLFERESSKTTLIKYPAQKNDSEYLIPDGVNSLGYKAFEDCDYLTSIVVPETVKHIDNCAFVGCKNLKKLTLPARFIKETELFSDCIIENIIYS